MLHLTLNSLVLQAVIPLDELTITLFKETLNFKINGQICLHQISYAFNVHVP